MYGFNVLTSFSGGSATFWQSKASQILVMSAQPPPRMRILREPLLHVILGCGSFSSSSPHAPAVVVDSGVGASVSAGVGAGVVSGVGA